MKKLLVRTILFVLVLTVVAAVTVYALLSRSLPQLDGEVVAGHLAADVTINRDASGIPSIIAANRIDLAYATGYVHAQDRFFPMDLTRRKAAGELAEIVGAAALPLDTDMRFHRFRARAKLALERLNVSQNLILQAYTDGVNHGLNNLGTKPFEYYLLGVEPRAWEMADSLLIVFAMFIELNDETAKRDVGRGLVLDVAVLALPGGGSVLFRICVVEPDANNPARPEGSASHVSGFPPPWNSARMYRGL